MNETLWVGLIGALATILAVPLALWLGARRERNKSIESLGREVARIEGQQRENRGGGDASDRNLAFLLGKVVADVAGLVEDVSEIKQRQLENSRRSDEAHRSLSKMLQGQIDKLAQEVTSIQRTLQGVVTAMRNTRRRLKTKEGNME